MFMPRTFPMFMTLSETVTCGQGRPPLIESSSSQIQKGPHMSTFESQSVSELEEELQEQELLIDGMLDAPVLEMYAPSAPPRSRSIGKDPYIPPPTCRKQLERTEVVVVGGGFAGL